MVFTPKTYDEIVKELTQYILEHQDEITDFNIGSVIRALIEAYALELSSEELNGLYQQLIEVYNATRISTAEGEDLDELATLLGVKRKEGVKASGKVTFGRQSSSTVDFDIPSGAVVSTQPVPNEESLRYVVKSTTTFYHYIENEEHTFIDGVEIYLLDQRLVDSITSIKGIIDGSETTLSGSDYELIKGYDGEVIKDVDMIEDCDNDSGWNKSSDATDVEIDSDSKQGSGSLKIGKNNTTSSSVYYYKSFIDKFDITHKKLFMWLYFNTSLVSDIDHIEVWFGNDESNYLLWEILSSDLSNGWNRIFLQPEDSTYIGYPKIDELDYFRIVIVCKTTSTTFTNDMIKLDMIALVKSEEYEGDVVKFITKLDNDTTFKASYTPLSVEVEVEAEEVGKKYNVAKHKITYMVSNISGIDFVDNYEVFNNGEDKEDDEHLRQRLREATYVLGKATVKAIENNLKSLSYIKSAKVDDMPLKHVDNEEHTFSSTESKYLLQHEVALNNENRRVVAGETTLTTDISESDTSIPVDDTSEFPDSGYIIIDDEIIQYSSKTSTSFEGCSRGVEGTTATTHSNGSNVVGWYKPDVDYVFTKDNNISWIGNTPPDGVVFKVSYDYRWLGHIDVYVVGNTALTTEQINEVNDLIQNEYKAAGVYYELKTPTYVDINVNVGIKPKNGYTFEEIKPKVVEVLRDKLNSYGIGEDVYISQLYDVIHNIEGVLYAHITQPSNDVEISDSEIARAGVIVVNSL